PAARNAAIAASSCAGVVKPAMRTRWYVTAPRSERVTKTWGYFAASSARRVSAVAALTNAPTWMTSGGGGAGRIRAAGTRSGSGAGTGSATGGRGGATAAVGSGGGGTAPTGSGVGVAFAVSGARSVAAAVGGGASAGACPSGAAGEAEGADGRSEG